MLFRSQGDFCGHFGGVEDRAGGVFTGGFRAAVGGHGNHVDVGLGGVHPGVHVGDFALDQFEFTDGLAELLALADVRTRGAWQTAQPLGIVG